MKIDPKLVEQWGKEWNGNEEFNLNEGVDYSDYIAQRAADHALEEAAKVCASLFDLDDDSCDEAETCIEAIRAMKGTK